LSCNEIIAFLCHEHFVELSPSFVYFQAVFVQGIVELDQFEGLFNADGFFLKRHAVLEDRFAFSFVFVSVL
jgi:hypothetical protein